MNDATQQEFELAAAQHRAGQLREAEIGYRRILAREPSHADALHMLGMIAQQLGYVQPAIDLISRAIAINPRAPLYHANLGFTLAGASRREEAEAAFRRALAIDPANARIRQELGKTLAELSRYDESIACFMDALRLAPQSAELMSDLSNALRFAKRHDEAIQYGQRAIALRQDLPDAYKNLGLTYAACGRFTESLSAYESALALLPDDHEIRWLLGLMQLQQGDWPRGLAAYESHRNLPETPRIHQFEQPAWDGSDLAGRRLLVHADQAFGDTVQMVRYVPLLTAKSADVTIETQWVLKELLEMAPGMGRVISRGDELPPFDVHCPVMSLPRVFGTTVETIPSNVPYLFAEDRKIEQWRQTIAQPGDQTGQKNVGLVWSGRPLPAGRSVPLEKFAPLAQVKGVRWHSLQVGDAAAQAGGAPMPLIDWSAQLTDFQETAALMCALDLVITIDTAAAHLAGALGRPVWMILQTNPDWRWLLNRSDTRWYPTMRLFRQSTQADWDAPIQQIAEELSR